MDAVLGVGTALDRIAARGVGDLVKVVDPARLKKLPLRLLTVKPGEESRNPLEKPPP
jgi:hypothetical protein